MTHYHFRINNSISNKKNDAGNKAVSDCKEILLRNGYIDLEIYLYKPVWLLPVNIVKLVVLLGWYLVKVRKGSLFMVQYPLLGINKFFGAYAWLLKKGKDCRFSCIIHDLDSIRSLQPAVRIPEEIKALSAYEAVIAHNPAMTAWLRTNGYSGGIHEIGLFDYLSNRPLETRSAPSPDEPPIVVFAGNLARTNFLHLIKNIPNLRLNVYGPGYGHEKAFNDVGTAIKWLGSFDTDEIVSRLKGHYGLVWDGDSTDECAGKMGNYLRYNTSHKASLYLLAGLPLIVPSSAAIAPIIRSGGLGICVSSLEQLPELLAGVDEAAYNDMTYKIGTIRNRLSTGDFFTSAFKNLEQKLAE